jgi:hypothetical protein
LTMLRKNHDVLVMRCRSYPHLVESIDSIVSESWATHETGNSRHATVGLRLLFRRAMMHVHVNVKRSSQPAGSGQRNRPSKQKSNGGMKWASALHHDGHRGTDTSADSAVRLL